MTDELELLKKRILELAARADARGIYCATDFLTLAEQEVVKSLSGLLSSVPYTLFGGAKDCERKLAFFGSEALCGYEKEPPVACVEIAPVNARFTEHFTHRDCLGALMNLGIERGTLGDIVVGEGKSHLFCTEAIAPFIVENLTRVGRTSVRCKITDAPPARAENALTEERIQLASCRLDALVAHAYRLPREEGARRISIGEVFLNGAAAKSASTVPKEGDIVSVRGCGRFRYLGVSGTSRKGKLIVTVEKYGG